MGGHVDSRSDQELIRDINAADGSAFESLYFRYRDWVVGLAYRFTLNHEDALDVLQETFAYVSRKFPGFALTASMKTFLYPVVRNLSLEIRRKRGRAVQDEIAFELLPARMNLSADHSDLLSVLSNLPQTHREVLLMRFIDGLKIEEIAQAMQVPVGTVKSRLHNALEQLKSDPRIRRYFEI